jgi:DNA-binding beta-propeller fold protein YncE
MCSKSRKILLIGIFIALFDGLIQGAVADPEISLGTVNASAGDTVEVPVSFANDGTAAAIQIDIHYDSAQLASDDPVAGVALIPHGLASSIISPGIRRTVITPPSDNPLVKSGELVRLPFTVLTHAAAASRVITVSNVIISDAVGGNVTPGIVGGGLIGDPANLKSDQDADGMPDSWEITYSLNPFDAVDASIDTNGDGYTNLQDYQMGRDPIGQPQPIPSRLYLSNHASTNDTSRIVVIDPVTNREVTSIPMVEDPEGLVANPDGSMVYAAVGADLSVIDVQTNTEINHLSAVAGTDSTVGLLEDMAISPDGSALYLAYRRIPEATLEIKVLDASESDNPVVNGAIDDSSFDGCYAPLGLAVRPDGSELYLVCRPTAYGDPDRFYMVDTASGVVTQTATFARDSSNLTLINAVTVNHDGSRVYVSRTDRAGSTVEIFDGGTGGSVASITLPRNALPRHSVLSPDGSRLYVVDERLGTHVIDTANNTVLTTMSYTNTRGIDIVVSPDGSRLYVSLLFNVYVLDNATNAWSSTITGDFNHAYQMVLTPGN